MIVRCSVFGVRCSVDRFRNPNTEHRTPESRRCGNDPKDRYGVWNPPCPGRPGAARGGRGAFGQRGMAAVAWARPHRCGPRDGTVEELAAGRSAAGLESAGPGRRPFDALLLPRADLRNELP